MPHRACPGGTGSELVAASGDTRGLGRVLLAAPNCRERARTVLNRPAPPEGRRGTPETGARGARRRVDAASGALGGISVGWKVGALGTAAFGTSLPPIRPTPILR